MLEPFRDRIEYLESENRGKPSALNFGMDRVTSEYVWIMDDDDVALRDALERHVVILENRPEVGWTYSSFIESTTCREGGRIVPHAEKALPDFPEEEFLIRLMEQCFLVHPTILVRASCYRQVGSFQGDLVRSQDYEMAVRLARKFPSARVVGPTIYHRMHGGTRSDTGGASDAGQVRERPNRLFLTDALKYEQIFFRRLRGEMALSEYVPGRRILSSKALDLRQAYLRRMGIMARKRLYDEMIEDLRLAQEDSDKVPVLSAAERQLLHETFKTIDDPLFFQKDLLRRIRSVCYGPVGFAIRLELIRCLYWSAIGATRRGCVSEVVGSASAAMQLAGAGVLRSFLHDRGSNRRAANSSSRD